MNQQLKNALQQCVAHLYAIREINESLVIETAPDGLNLCDIQGLLETEEPEHANFEGLINLATHPKVTKRELRIYAEECRRTLGVREIPSTPEKPLPWHVVTVSTNRGSFGHAGVIVLNENGEGLELTLQAYGVDPLPKVGDVLEVLPRSEIQPRALPGVTPERAKQIIVSLTK